MEPGTKEGFGESVEQYRAWGLHLRSLSDFLSFILSGGNLLLCQHEDLSAGYKAYTDERLLLGSLVLCPVVV